MRVAIGWTEPFGRKVQQLAFVVPCQMDPWLSHQKCGSFRRLKRPGETVPKVDDDIHLPVCKVAQDGLER